MKKEVKFGLFSATENRQSNGIQKFYSDVELIKDFRDFKSGKKFAGAQFCIATSTLTLYEEEYGEIVRTHSFILDFIPVIMDKKKAEKITKKVILSSNNPITITKIIETVLSDKPIAGENEKV